MIELAERWADGEHDPDATWTAHSEAIQAMGNAFQAGDYETGFALNFASACVHESDPLFLCVQSVPSVWERLRNIGRNLADWYRLGVCYRKRQPNPQSWCGIIRDIFGNPFRPVAFDPSWRTVAVVALATSIYEERAFDRMPILADALEDAGCDNADIIGHLRDPNATHVRGCWALDLVLGKV
jgi:hypothetical protein